MKGITDKDDKLNFDIIFQNGVEEYNNWFINFAKKRFKIKNKN